MKRVFVLGVAVCLLTASGLMAQEKEPLTSVALFRVKYDGMDSWLTQVKKFSEPVLKKLLADGVVTGYGVDVDMLHTTDQTNAAIWWTVENYAALQKAEDAVHAAQQKDPVTMKAIRAATDMDKHADLIVRSIYHSQKKPAAGVLPVSSFSMSQIKPGKMRDFRNGFEKISKPVYDKLVADGAILGYQVDVEEYHTMTPGRVWVIVTANDLSAFDKVDAAFEDSRKLLSPDELKRRGDQMREIFDSSAHRDMISRAALYEMK